MAFGHEQSLIERHILRISAALLISAGPRTVDENPPHHPRRDGEEVPAVLPLNLIDVNQSKVSLVNQCGSLKRLTRTFVGHVSVRKFPKIGVHDLEQAILGDLITFTPCRKKLCDLLR